MPAAQRFQRITDFHGFDPWRARRNVTGIGGFLRGPLPPVNAQDGAKWWARLGSNQRPAAGSDETLGTCIHKGEGMFAFEVRQTRPENAATSPFDRFC
jgi:hypothetical protein